MNKNQTNPFSHLFQGFQPKGIGAPYQGPFLSKQQSIPPSGQYPPQGSIPGLSNDGQALLPNASFAFSQNPLPPSPVTPGQAVPNNQPIAPAPRIDSSARPTPTKPSQAGFTPTGLYINEDGTTDFAKSLAEGKRRLEEMQKQAELLSVQQKKDTPYLGTSESVRQDEQNVEQELNKIITSEQTGQTRINPNTGAEEAITASQAYLDLLDSQITALDQRRASELASIEASFAGAKESLLGEQKRETGATTMGLARMGGYLGGSASQTGVLINLAHQHRGEIANLEAKKQQALQEAKNAISDKQFALARMRLEEVKNIEKTVYERKNDFFERSLKLSQEDRRQNEFERDKYKDELEQLATVALSNNSIEMDPARAQAIDSFYGVPGFTQQYLDVARAAANTKAEKDKVSVQKNLLDLLSKIPQGQEVTFPDGTKYVGMGSASDIYSSMQVDDNGMGRIINQNKRTGEVSVTPVGLVGKSKTQGSGDGGMFGSEKDLIKQNVLDAVVMQLSNRQDNNGKFSPEYYLDLRNDIKKEYPGLVADIDRAVVTQLRGKFSEDSLEVLRKKGGIVTYRPAGLFE